MRIDVAIFDDDEIFRRGVTAVIDDDEQLHAVYVSRSWTAAHGAAVAVVGPSSIPLQTTDTPLVACIGTDVAERLSDRTDVYAILDRRQLPAEHLTEAIRAAAVGLRIRRPDDRGVTLGEREVQVLELLADGEGTKDIAARLGFSERTIKQVIADVNRSLAVRTRAAAVAVALRNGVI